MFRASAPVTGTGFHDRKAALDELLAAFDALTRGAPRWLAVLGPRKIGKTSLILEAARRTPTVKVVVLDALEHAPLTASFFRTLALRGVDALLAGSTGTSLAALAREPDSFQAALAGNAVVAALPDALRIELTRLPRMAADGDSIPRWLQLLEDLCAALRQHLVVAIDEVQELVALASGRFEPFPVMRAVWQRHERVGYVISGSSPSVLRELVTARHSPFFQHFRLLEIGPFDRDDAISLLVSGAPPERAIEPRIAGRIHDVVGGHPFYLQIVGEALVGTEPPYDDGSIKAVFQSLLFSRTGRLSLYFENQYQRTVGRASTLAAAIQALADRPRARLTEVAVQIGASPASTARYLDRLGDLVVRDEGGLFRLVDPLFATWVRWRSPGGAVVPMTVVGDEAEIAVARLLASYGFDLVYQSRASRGAFDLLALRGPIQLGLQVKRSRLPLRFKKGEWNRMQADAKRWGWRWAVVSVAPDGAVTVLDPAKSQSGREVRLHDDAAVDNILGWLERG
ncbi:MAG: ATP-binding protein [Deltaproteobacteria bacterium]|nr:ATP-binding protein [Deltaproteobacteria bacterium]